MGKYQLKYIFIICINFFIVFWLLKIVNMDMLWLSFFGLLIILMLICVIIIAIKYKKISIIIFSTLILMAHCFMLFVNQSIFEVIQVTNIEHKSHNGLTYSITIERLGYNISLLCDKDMYDLIQHDNDYEFIYSYSIVFPHHGKLIHFKPVKP